MTNDRKQLIDKIVKLMALADDQAGKPEAEVARRKVSELMAKNNIALQDLEQTKSTFIKKEQMMQRKTHYKFDTLLVNHIFKFNEVALLLINNGNYMYVGRQQDIEAAEYMLDLVMQQRKQAVKVWADDMQNKGWARPGTTEQDKFKNGFAIGVGIKLRELTKMAEGKVQEWGLVPINGADLALNWYKDKHKVTSSKSKPVSYHQAGVAAGKNVSLNKGVTTQSSTKQLN